jgi:hypothetical protein
LFYFHILAILIYFSPLFHSPFFFFSFSSSIF